MQTRMTHTHHPGVPRVLTSPEHSEAMDRMARRMRADAARTKCRAGFHEGAETCDHCGLHRDRWAR